jgi:hypothetical protein
MQWVAPSTLEKRLWDCGMPLISSVPIPASVLPNIPSPSSGLICLRLAEVCFSKQRARLERSVPHPAVDLGWTPRPPTIKDVLDTGLPRAYSLEL